MLVSKPARPLAPERPTSPPIEVPTEVCRDYSAASHREWLVTNGTGGYAMGTVSGANTRRYHGLLVASLHPPVDRAVMLAKVDEEVVVDGSAIALGTNQYPGAVHPEGYKQLRSFRLDPFPVWQFEAGAASIEKRLFVVHGEQTLVLRYRATAPCTLRVAPFVACRDFHALAQANTSFDPGVEEIRIGASTRVSVRPYAALPALALHHNGEPLQRDGTWSRATEYLEEQARGFDFREDLYKIGTLIFEVAPDRDAWIVVTLRTDGRYTDGQVAAMEAAEIHRLPTPADDPLVTRLARAADAFVVRRNDGRPTLIAGYPWFADWGRDTMIAIPGLLLARGRRDEARDVLRAFLEHLSKGIIPNRFADRAGEPPEYNAADATLWMFQAARAYVAASGDDPFLRNEFYPHARDIIRWHELGTHHDIRVDPGDGLLAAGSEGSQLTWMDARVDGRPATSRHGKAVEINALYYNALRLMAEWAARLEPNAAAHYTHAADRAQAAFAPTFWNAERRCLFDVVTDQGPDRRLRPNQLFAVSLPFPLLSPAQRSDVLRAVDAHLLTPVGLRTLAPGDPGYIGRYAGGPRERDGAYHQGTVWPWLLGPYVRAYLQVNGRSAETLLHCRGLLRGLEGHLNDGCLGSIGEVFDGDPPFCAGGAPAQAWSVAELLQILTEDLAGSPSAI